MSKWHQLIFTKDGDLDFGWIILIFCCVVGLSIFVAIAFGLAKKEPSTAAWAWFGSFTTMSFISGAAISRARLIANSNAVGDVAKGIAMSAPEQVIPQAWANGDPQAGVM
jgi:hypothetical protein